MAGVFSRAKEFFRGTLLSGGAHPPQGDYEEYDDDYEEDRYRSGRRYDYDRRGRYEEYDEEEPERGRSQSSRQEQKSHSRGGAFRTSGSGSNVVDMYSSSKGEPQLAESIIAKPIDINEAVNLCDYVRQGRMVIVDLSRANDPDCQRIADYLSGACQMAGGEIRRVNNGIFTIAPKNHRVTTDYYDEVDTGDIRFSSAFR